MNLAPSSECQNTSWGSSAPAPPSATATASSATSAARRPARPSCVFSPSISRDSTQPCPSVSTRRPRHGLTPARGRCYNARAMSAVVFILGTLAVLLALAWVTYQSGKLLRSVPVRENLLLAPVENGVKAAVIALCVGLAAISGLPPAQFGWTFAHPGEDLLAGLVLGLGAQL